jgi:hypothetical protein
MSNNKQGSWPVESIWTDMCTEIHIYSHKQRACEASKQAKQSKQRNKATKKVEQVKQAKQSKLARRSSICTIAPHLPT